MLFHPPLRAFLAAITLCTATVAPADASPPGIAVRAFITNGHALQDGKGAAASFYRCCTLTVDPHDTVYAIDPGHNAIRKISPDGRVVTMVTLPTRILGQDYIHQDGIAVDSIGTVYLSISSSQAIFRIDPDGHFSTFAGKPGVVGHEDGPRETATFSTPAGLLLDRQGNLYVADSGNNVIRRISPDGRVSTFAGGQRGTRDGSLAQARFDGPWGLAMDRGGNLFVSECGEIVIEERAENGCELRRIAPSGTVTTIGVNYYRATMGGKTKARRIALPDPSAVAVDSRGRIYYYSGSAVFSAGKPVGKRKFEEYFDVAAGASTDHNGRYFLVQGYGNTYMTPYAEGAGRNFDLSGIAIDSHDTIYVASQDYIARATTAGDTTMLAGRPFVPDPSLSRLDSSWVNARRLLSDAAGTLYFQRFDAADGGHESFVQVSPDGKTSTSLPLPRSDFVRPLHVGLGKNGDIYFSTTCDQQSCILNMGPDGNSTPFYRSKNTIQDFAVDTAGTLWIITVSNQVFKLAPAGEATVVATIHDRGLSLGDRYGRYDHPETAMAVADSGDVYISNASAVFHISPQGKVSLLAGHSRAMGHVDGAGHSARFDHITALALSHDGRLFAGETGNADIREISPDGQVSTFLNEENTGTAHYDLARLGPLDGIAGLTLLPDGQLAILNHNAVLVTQ